MLDSTVAVGIGSLSKRKIEITQEVFAERFSKVHIEGADVKSLVSDSPMNSDVLLGARNRAQAVSNLVGAEFSVGIESGIVERFDALYEETWCVIIRQHQVYQAYSSGLILPEIVSCRMLKQEHYRVMEELETELNLPHDTWKNYSGGIIERAVSIREAVRNCLTMCVPGPLSLYCASCT